jgi:hypothetical protein
LHPAYSTVDESKLYKARQDATGTSEDFSCESEGFLVRVYFKGLFEKRR